MISDKNIMVYYHCYEIVSEASLLKPEPFYKYWDVFRNLLHHENSYHRDIGLTVIANLSKSDEKNLIIEVIDEYLEHARDEKFMTSKCCIKNSLKIMLNKPELMKKIINYFINLADNCNYPLKQKELLINDIIEAFDAIYIKHDNKMELMNFVRNKTTSGSPKTRKKAKSLSINNRDIDNHYILSMEKLTIISFLVRRIPELLQSSLHPLQSL